jgi:hypothetical protein
MADRREGRVLDADGRTGLHAAGKVPPTGIEGSTYSIWPSRSGLPSQSHGCTLVAAGHASCWVSLPSTAHASNAFSQSSNASESNEPNTLHESRNMTHCEEGSQWPAGVGRRYSVVPPCGMIAAPVAATLSLKRVLFDSSTVSDVTTKRPPP